MTAEMLPLLYEYDARQTESYGTTVYASVEPVGSGVLTVMNNATGEILATATNITKIIEITTYPIYLKFIAAAKTGYVFKNYVYSTEGVNLIIPDNPEIVYIPSAALTWVSLTAIFEQTIPPPSQYEFPWWILGVAAGVALVVGVGVAYKKSKEKEKEKRPV
jgi:hypothetical protein